MAPSALGRTLTHEHLSMQFDVCFVPPDKPELAELEWNLGNFGWISGHPYRSVLFGHNHTNVGEVTQACKLVSGVNFAKKYWYNSML